MDELDLEKAARAFEGETLARVFYQSTGCGGSSAWARAGPHSVPLAVYLEMISGQRFRVYWADQFNLHHGHGIAIARAPAMDRDLGPVEETTLLPTWVEFIGARIQSAMVRWRNVSDALRSSFRGVIAVHGDSVRRRDYPLAVELGFENGVQVTIAAAHLVRGQVTGFANNLLVVFGRAGAGFKH